MYPIIDYPNSKSEFEIHAETYTHIRKSLLEFSVSQGLEIRGEVKGPKLKTRRGNCRFDLVLFQHKKAIMIIECKDRRPVKLNKKTRQYRTYSSFNIPLIYCYGECDNDMLCEEIFKTIKLG